MSALTLPLDNRESNNYIHALERQFKGKFRAARDVSVYFTSRPDTEQDFFDMLPFFQAYKLLDSSSSFEPPIDYPLDTALSLQRYQVYFDGTGLFNVQGTGVIGLATYYHLVPSGTELTVEQNGSGSVPSAETFIALGDPVIVWYGDIGGDPYLYPYIGKAWYGAITAPAEDGSNADNIRLVLLMADGTYHSQKLGSEINPNFVFFTHLYNDTSTDAEVYFTGKELDYVPDDLPTGDFVAADITYVPD